MKIFSRLAVLLLLAVPVLGQQLPFEISEKKKLSEKDLKNKKEGWYPTGLPLVNSDPNTGIGYGVRLFLFNNGSKDDPLFAYTPYKTRMYIQYFNTTRNYQYHEFNVDSTYIFNTPWRFRGAAAYERNLNKLYFGADEQTLQPLSHHIGNQENLPVVRNSTFNLQEETLAYRRKGDPYEAPYVTDKMYYRYDHESPQAIFSFERDIFKGLARLVAGLKFSQNTIRTYDGEIYEAKDPYFQSTQFPELNWSAPVPNSATKVTEDHEAGKISGYEGGYVNYLRLGIVAYDSRDFEPDPNRGIFWEITHQRSDKALGSDFQFNKTFTQAYFFASPFEDKIDKLVFAGRVGFGVTEGDAPFFEMRHMWGTANGINGLGGLRTLRGFKQDRFVGRAIGFGNLEMRWKFHEIKAGTETFAFNLVPFVDFGRVWDDPEKASTHGYKYSQGLGLRIAWNQATIIMIDYAVSREDKQLFVNFNHIF